MSYCVVAGCRFPYSHVTSGHLCSKCKKYGHGQIECGKKNMMDYLVNYFTDEMASDKQCTIIDCKNKNNHSRDAHHCRICLGRHHYKECSYINFETGDFKVKCPFCKKINEIKESQPKAYGLEEKCKICMTNDIEVYFPGCGHTVVCYDCLKELSDDYADDIFSEARKIFNGQDGKIYTIIPRGMGSYSYVRRDDKSSRMEELFMHSDSYDSGSDMINYLDNFIDGYIQITQS